ncbi:unnamed protein product [Cylicocyclus nassatus]|uniref:Uncharacterized protein n=1 Tax=Cylicocyclus nassatus TaxID=53992 RepID=A0AA36DL69_CYLNA|nr:unnamed protein product [Cylicocyclus nassatus]
MVSSRTVKELGVFTGLIVAAHYAYWKIQMNPSLVAPEQRSELFYIRWLKDKYPSLRKYGVQDYKPEEPSVAKEK